MSQGGSTSSWPTLQAFIDNDGQLTLGRIGPVACAAVAAQDDQMLVALVRHDNESLPELLARLEDALTDALDNEIYIDEING